MSNDIVAMTIAMIFSGFLILWNKIEADDSRKARNKLKQKLND